MRRRDPQLNASEHHHELDVDIGDTAIFFDWENIVFGVEKGFSPAAVVDHFASRGDVLIRRAYADWGRYSREQAQLLELGVEMVFLPTYGIKDKNRTDTAIAVDAMEILFTRPSLDTFVIVSGDSDFGVLARKLRGYGKLVIGVSARSSASKVLVSVCNQFVFYESLVGETTLGMEEGEKLIRRALPSIAENRTSFQPSLLKDRLRKLDPTFSERNYGFSSFLRFVESFPHLIVIERGDGGQTRLSQAEGERRRGSDADGDRRRGSDRHTATRGRPRDAGRSSRQGSAVSDRERQPDEPKRGPPAGADPKRPPEASKDTEPRQGGRPQQGPSAEARSRPRGTPGQPSAAQRGPGPQPPPGLASASEAARSPEPKSAPGSAEPGDPRSAAALDACRKLLRAVVGTLGDEEVTLVKLKARLTARVPTFTHQKLGYKTFTDFLRAQPDIVTVKSHDRRVRVKRADSR